MRDLFKPLTIAALAAIYVSPVAAADYIQAAGSTLTFTTRYQGEAYVGTLPGFVTRLSFDPAHLADARLEVDIPLGAVSIDHADSAETVKSSEFFNIAKFPRARYSAKGFRALGGQRYAAEGTLALRGVNRPVTLTFSWVPGATAVLAGTAQVKRLDFGVGSGEWADTQILPNEVVINTRVLLKAQPAPTTTNTATNAAKSVKKPVKP